MRPSEAEALKLEDDEHIGPYNGHYKSEALPLFIYWLGIGAIAFVLLMAVVGPLLPEIGGSK